jgi:hopanoid biosynthesis associated RND transporter like protein HpnN
MVKGISTPMLNIVIARIVEFCTRHIWPIILVAALLAAASGTYAARHFSINADVTKLISSDLPWRQRELAYESVFTHGTEIIVAVVDAPTPELATAATKALVDRLTPNTELFHSVQSVATGEFFVRNRFLFLPTEEVNGLTGRLSQAGPLLSQLTGDPSLRGLVQALSLTLTGVEGGQVTLDGLARPLNMSAEAIEKVLAGEPAWFSWYVLMNGQPATTSELRRIVTIKPVLDFHALQPGEKATDGIRKAVADLNLAGEFGAKVRLTGPVPIADEEFGTLKEGAALNGAITIAVVLLILWLALKSYRIILAVFINLVVGLAITAAVGLMMVGSLNLISIAFAVLFVGLGVDFGIQFSVRYRTERHECSDLHLALKNAGERAGAPLTLAAAAVAAGFLSFLPTDYRGVSELGLIAGLGMVIAFLTSITLLPALLQLLNPPGEAEPLGYAALAPVDRFLEDHRVPVIVGTLLIAVAGLPLLMYLHFDFNPINLRSPKVESIATYLDLRRDPNMNSHTAEVVAPSIAEAAAIAKKLSDLPQVARAITIDSFVPTDQQPKLTRIRAAATALRRALNPPAVKPPPTDAEVVAALRNGAQGLRQTAGNATGAGADAAKRLANDLVKLADAGAAQRAAATKAMVAPMVGDLADLRTALQAEPVTRENIPPGIAREWVAPDGRARVEAALKGDPNDNEAIRAFARAVLATAPSATGEAIGILESGTTIVHAFLEAGAWALLSISILLWIVLRRIGDVLLTLVPLLLAGVVTLEICVLIDFPLNFANIIALPLLLGVGVAFKIYYVMAWRGGQTSLLQSSLTRAVFFSAMTTATAFGSLWFSSHPGTSSMGKLLALSLVCTLAAAVLFQPALMGRPRENGDASAAQ